MLHMDWHALADVLRQRVTSPAGQPVGISTETPDRPSTQVSGHVHHFVHVLGTQRV